MRDLIVLRIHLTAFLLARPAGLRAVVAESVLIKRQLSIMNRSRRRPKGPNVDAISAVVEMCAVEIQARDRARLAEKLLESLKNLSNAENEILWAEEAERRDATWSSSVGGARTAKRVLRDARAKIR
jgi:hypothetical protein